MSSREQMKRQLCAAIDDLSEDKGFVLVVTDDEISFTALGSGAWDSDSYITVEQLTQAEVRQESVRLDNEVKRLRRAKQDLEGDVEALRARRDDLNAAIANALGGRA